MDAITIHLKRRENKGEIRISIPQLLAWFSIGDPGVIGKNLHKFFKPIADQLESNQFVHDAEQLKFLVDWGIQAQKSFAVQQKFDRLRRRLEDVDLTKECNFPLNSFQVKLIWERLQDDDFKAPSAMFVEFMTEFIAAVEQTGTKWPTGDPGDEGEIEYIDE